MYDQRIMDHTKMKRMEEMVVITVKAAITVGITMSMAEPSSRQRQEKNRPLRGTAFEDSLPKLLGATATCARPNSMRLVE